jgi:tRNA/tmRNA/rRNA uracil-C5-methylase (TrmA/RlmC/RlmD family)
MKKTNIDHIINELKKLQSAINFTIEKEQNKSIILLDLTIHRTDKNIQFSIYRKPTQTDIIPINSCHLYEHELSGINYMLNRLHTRIYQITEKAKNKVEKNTIKNILHNNEYDINLIKKPPEKNKNRIHKTFSKHT